MTTDGPAGAFASSRDRSATGLKPVPGALLDATALVGRGVLHEGDQPIRDEPTRSDRLPGAGHLADLDDTPRRHDLDPSTGASRDDLERLDALAGVDNGLDAIAFHGCVRPLMRAR
jgi:hypothetical protein